MEVLLTPHLGIFWLNKDLTTILYADVYPDNLDMASFSKTGQSHESFWYEYVLSRKVVHPSVKIIPDDFTFFPRGRVSIAYEENTRTRHKYKAYTIHLGEFLTGNQEVIKLIKTHFGLKGQLVKVIPDNQYN